MKINKLTKPQYTTSETIPTISHMSMHEHEENINSEQVQF